MRNSGKKWRIHVLIIPGSYLFQNIKTIVNVHCSVADPGCLSRIPDPEFYPSRIPDPKTAATERNEKKIVDIPFF
jgi:hypothetical protein